MRRRSISIISACSIIALTACGSTALAQSASSTETPGETTPSGDIVVTAQKRVQRLQDVAASVAVVSGDSLRTMTASNYTDYLNSIPSVSYTKNGAYKDKIFIRGLSDTLSSRVLSTTGIYIDETPITEVDGSLGDLGTFDLNRVEVLRGPQGTLFGSGSMGGTVRVITNKPKFDRVEGEVEAQVSGTDHGGTGYEGNAVINLPILADRIALRVTGGYHRDPGYIDNLLTGEKDINDSHSAFVRGQLAIKPLDDLDILLGVQYQKSRSEFGPNQDIGRGDYNVVRYYPEDNRFTTRIYSATINYALPFATITSATSLIDKDNFSIRDYTSLYRTPIQNASGVVQANEGIGLEYRFPNKAFIQEGRIASTTSGPLHWLAGVYYNNFHPNNTQTYRTTVPGLNFNYTLFDIQAFRRETAEFGEASLDLSHRLTITGGVRHSHFSIGQDETDTGFTIAGGRAVIAPKRVQQNATVYKARADFKITQDNLVYGVASEGYRPGGPVSSFVSTCAAQLQSLGYATPPTSYNPDRLWNYEIGSKNQFLNHMLTINAAAYIIKWQNTQVAQNLTCGSQFISNAGGATSKGVELEIRADPVRGLEVALSGGYTKATFDTTDSTIRTIKGATLPNVPKWTISPSAQYTQPIGRGIDVFGHVDLQYVGARYSDLPAATTNVREPSYTLVNARVGVDYGKWQLAVFAKNLTNELAIYNTANTSLLNYQSINQPRTIGLEARRQF